MANIFEMMKRSQAELAKVKQTDAYKDSLAAKQNLGWDAAKSKELKSNMSGSYDSAYAKELARQKMYSGGVTGQTLSKGQMEEAARKAAEAARAKAEGAFQSYSKQYSPTESQIGQATTERTLRDVGTQTMQMQLDRSGDDRAAKDAYLAQQQTGMGALSDALKQYQDIASGKAPSVAGQQYAQSRDDMMNQALAMSASSTGSSALARNNAMQGLAGQQAQLAQGAALARSQEQLGALGAGTQVAGQMLGNQMQQAGLMQQGELAYQGYGGNSMGFLQGQQQSLYDNTYRNDQLDQQMRIAQMELDMQRRQQNLGIFSSLIGAAGAAGGAALGKPG